MEMFIWRRIFVIVILLLMTPLSIDATPNKCFSRGAGEIIGCLHDLSASLIAFDYDNDGDLDFLECSNFIYLYSNDKGYKEELIYEFGPINEKEVNDTLVYGGLAVGDFNNDGYMDFIAGGLSGTIRLFINNHSEPLKPRFNVYRLTKFGQTAWGLTTADFNHDGLMDFAVSWATCPLNYSRVTIFYNPGNLVFKEVDIYTLEDNYIEDIEAADFDGDNDVDILLTRNICIGGWIIAGEYSLLRNNGDGTFIEEEVNPFLRLLGSFGFNRVNPHIAIGDYDMDGDIDFLEGDNTGKVELFLNDGIGRFTRTGVIHDFGSLSWGLASGDFDGDGDLDFIVSSTPVIGKGMGYIYLKHNIIIE